MSLVEEGGAEALPDMDQRADQHVVGFLSVRDVVGLEAKAAIAGNQFVSAGADAGKVCQRPKVRSKPAW